MHAIGVTTLQALLGSFLELLPDVQPGASCDAAGLIMGFHELLQAYIRDDSAAQLPGGWGSAMLQQPHLKAFIRGCCSADPEQRMSVQQLLECEWLQGAAEQLVRR